MVSEKCSSSGDRKADRKAGTLAGVNGEVRE